MLALAVAAVAAVLAAGPDEADPLRVVDQGLGTNIEGRMAVVFPAAARRDGREQAVIYFKSKGRWCRVGTGDYVRGSNRVDRGGRNPSIRLIDRSERAVDMHWRDGRLVLLRGGRQIRTLDAPASGCN